MIEILRPSQYIQHLMNFDEDILEHGRRTAEYAFLLINSDVTFFEEYGRLEELDQLEVLQAIVDAAYLHDLGKMMYSKILMHKDSRLAEKIMEQHPVKTVEIIEIMEDFSKQSIKYQTIVKNACLYHHEKCDGSGYPYGLSKDDIPLEARIISVADILDTITHKRSHKNVSGFDEAIEHLMHIFTENREERFLRSFPQLFQRLKSVYCANYPD